MSDSAFKTPISRATVQQLQQRVGEQAATLDREYGAVGGTRTLGRVVQDIGVSVVQASRVAGYRRGLPGRTSCPADKRQLGPSTNNDFTE